VDVSEYQQDVDWDQVKAAGFDFAFIRIGYRGYSVGQIKPDDLAREHLASAKAAGLDVGVYFYAQAISPEEAAEEARWCLDFLGGEILDLPVVYDWEWVDRQARTGSMDRETLTECAKTFCQIIERSGHQAMIYFNTHVARDLLDLEELAEYPFWLAQYKDQMDFPHRIDLWQYTETGSVPGIQGDVDIDLMFIYE
jgi:GH25 family lysozyme M1 (1,4-beta-N-acetylmuramidase)